METNAYQNFESKYSFALGFFGWSIVAGIPVVGLIVSIMKRIKEGKEVEKLLASPVSAETGLELGFHRFWRGLWTLFVIEAVISNIWVLLILPITAAAGISLLS